MAAVLNAEALVLMRSIARSLAQLNGALTGVLVDGAIVVDAEATTESIGGVDAMDVQDRQTRRLLERIIELLERAELRALDPNMTGVL